VEYEQLPDASNFADDEKPIGALILAHQAVCTLFVTFVEGITLNQVEHAFKMWRTGEFSTPDSRRSGGQFSYDNYGDCIEHVKLAGSSKTTKIRKRRATQHVATVKSLSQDAWANIFAEADEYIGKGKRRKRS
jgi:hypothetical protein